MHFDSISISCVCHLYLIWLCVITTLPLCVIICDVLWLAFWWFWFMHSCCRCSYAVESFYSCCGWSSVMFQKKSCRCMNGVAAIVSQKCVAHLEKNTILQFLFYFDITCKWFDNIYLCYSVANIYPCWCGSLWSTSDTTLVLSRFVLGSLQAVSPF